MKPFIRKRGKLHYNSKKVNQYDINGNFIKTWDSMADIHRELDISTGVISNSCKYKFNARNGFIWRYYKNNIN